MPSLTAPPPNYRGLRQVDPPTPSNVELPAEFDQRRLFNNSVSINTVLDQGDCGSCWTFGSSSTVSDRLYRAGKANVIISPQQVLDCSRNCYPNYVGASGLCNNGCNGGSASRILLLCFHNSVLSLHVHNRWVFLCGWCVAGLQTWLSSEWLTRLYSRRSSAARTTKRSVPVPYAARARRRCGVLPIYRCVLGHVRAATRVSGYVR